MEVGRTRLHTVSIHRSLDPDFGRHGAQQSIDDGRERYRHSRSRVYLSTNLKPEDRPGGKLWPQYMREFHTSERELGDIAVKTGVRL
jgi:hypothetical protein